MVPCWIQQTPLQNAAEKQWILLVFTMASGGGRMPRAERTGAGNITQENL